MTQSVQKGSVLVISLLLLLIITIVGIAGISNSMLGERVAANQKQISTAFMAAETGLVQVNTWFQQPLNVVKYWGNLEATKSQMAGLPKALNEGVSWSVSDVTYHGSDQVSFQSCGVIENTNVKRCLINRLQQTQIGNIAGTGALNVFGNLNSVRVASSNAKVIGAVLTNSNGDPIQQGGGNVYIGAAVATDTEPNKDKIVTSIVGDKNQHADRLDNYLGGVQIAEFGGPFTLAADLDRFLKAVENECDLVSVPCFKSPNYASKDFDIKAKNGGFNFINNEEAIYILTCSPTCEVKGNETGKGILIVHGNLLFSGNPSFSGITIVTGDEFVVKGLGGGGLTGTTIVTNIVEDNGQLVFGSATATIDLDISGGGGSTIAYNSKNIYDAWALLKEDGEARAVWDLSDQKNSKGGIQIKVTPIQWQEESP